MGRAAVTVPVYVERLSTAFRLVRDGSIIRDALLSGKLYQGAFFQLYNAGLLEEIQRKGNDVIYRYPDPDKDDEKEAIEIMAQHLFDNPRKRYRDKSKKKATVGVKVKGAHPSKFLDHTTTEEVMVHATKILLLVQAPLGKLMPANFIKEMLDKDRTIVELKEEVRTLRAELDEWQKVEKAINQRKGAK